MAYKDLIDMQTNWGSFLPGGKPFRYNAAQPINTNIRGTEYYTDTMEPVNPTTFDRYTDNLSGNPLSWLGVGMPGEGKPMSIRKTAETLSDSSQAISDKAKELGIIQNTGQVNKMSMFPNIQPGTFGNLWNTAKGWWGDSPIGEDTSDLSGMAEVYRRPPLNQTNMAEVYRRPPLNQTNMAGIGTIMDGEDIDMQYTTGDEFTRDGIPALAEKKGFFPSILNLARGAINRYNPLYEGSQNYNPNLQGQVDALTQKGYLSGTGGKRGPYEITRGPLAGKNLVSLFGTNDYDQMLQNKADWFQRRKDSGKGFSQTNWDAVIAEQIKQKQNKDAASGAASGKTTTGEQGGYSPSKHYNPTTQQYQSPSQHKAEKSYEIKSGPMAGQTGYRGGRARGGRVGYKTGGRVGILSVF